MKKFTIKWLLLSIMLSVASVNSLWADTRTFKSGQEIFFKDASGSITWGSLNNYWKVSTGNIYAYFWNDTESGWSDAAEHVAGTENGANGIYSLTVPGSGKEFTKVLFTRGTAATFGTGFWNETTDQTPAPGKNMFCISNDGDYDGNRNPTHKWKGTWSTYANGPAIIGDMNGWIPDGGKYNFDGEIGTVYMILEANTDYDFKVLEGTTYYGNASTINNTITSWWGFVSGGSNCTIHTGEEGSYAFKWNNSSKTFGVYYPQARLTAGEYIYFDARDNTSWQAADFDARFYFKYYDSDGNYPDSETEHICEKSSAKEGWVYPFVVPSSDYIGHVQVNRIVNGEQSGIANDLFARDRANSDPNCIKLNSSDNSTSWTTYCPPMSKPTLSDNGPTTYGGDGSSEHPWLVEKNTSITFTASGSTTSVPDPNMTEKYEFLNDGSSLQDGTGTTYTLAVANANNTDYIITVDAYNYYNSTSSTHTASDAKYYTAKTIYGVSHLFTNVSRSSGGTDGSKVAADGVEYSVTLSPTTGYNLPASVTVSRGGSDITGNCTWTQGTGVLSIPGIQMTGNITITAAGEAKQCTITFNDNGGTDGSADKTATFDASMPALSAIPHKIGYAFAGYYDGVGGTGNRYYEADGSSATTWDKNTVSTTTLYAKWTTDTKTFNGGGADSYWATSGNWYGGNVPSNDYSSVTINNDVKIKSATSVHVGELNITSGNKLTIEAGGVLEVAGTVTTAGVEDLVIETSSTAQGALIYDISTTSPYATVNVTTSNASDGYFQYIASPVGAVSVSSVFAGTGAYTYAWIEGKGWERRGYYDDFGGDEVVLISGKYGCTFSGQLNPTTGHSITCTAEPSNEGAQGVNMIPNTLTAPIKIAAMDLSAAYEGAVHIWNGSTWKDYAKNSCGEAVIPALQGYAVLTETGGTVSFTYDAAVRRAATHNDALKAPQRTTSDIQDHITVSVITNDRKEDLLLYENNQFSDAIDKGWEAVYMEGDGRYGELYAQAAKPMSILAIDNLEGTVLGFAPGQAEDYTISFEGDGKGYYLNDVKKEEATLIAEGNTYTFTADESTNAKRFVISKTPIAKTPTSVENLNDGVKARKQLIDGVLYIVRDGKLYNATGTLVK